MAEEYKRKGKLTNNQQAFYEILKAGLWEKDVRLLRFDEYDFSIVKRIAEEQSVVGLIAAGFEKIQSDRRPSQEITLNIVGATLQLEQRNKAMNAFIESLIRKMRRVGIYALLLKGQGVAQCYERPLWRECGDVDLFLSDENYERAKAFLTPLATKVEPEASFKKHLGLYIEGWLVELHGRLRSGLSAKTDRNLDEILKETFYGGKVRSCLIENVQVFLLDVENDIVYVFSHILDHFYKGGVGLRQVCDWIRLLWVYHDKLDSLRIESRIKQMGLMSEWKAFGAFAVKYLGMPSEAMPMYDDAKKWAKKADRISRFVLGVGNFGRNRDMSYYKGKSFVTRKAISLKQRISDVLNHALIFPLDSIKFFGGIIVTGTKAAMKEK